MTPERIVELADFAEFELDSLHMDLTSGDLFYANKVKDITKILNWMADEDDTRPIEDV